MKNFGRVFLLTLGIALAAGAGPTSHLSASTDVIADYPGKAANFHCATRPTYSGMTQPYSLADKRGILQKMHDAGVTWVRVYVLWWQAEPSGPTFDPTYLNGLNECVNLITGPYNPPASYGMKILLVPYGTPGWAQPGYATSYRSTVKPPSDCLSPSALCTYFHEFVSTLAQNYQTNAAIEIWNEPDARNYWTAVCNADGTTAGANGSISGAACGAAEQNDARNEYSYMLNAASNAVGNGPDQVVLGGAVNASYFTAPSIHNWLSQLYTNPPPGITRSAWKAKWDVVALHPFPPYASSTDCPSVYDTFAPVRDAKDVMSANGDDLKPIWLTEVAWSIQNGQTTDQPCTSGGQEARLSEALTYTDLPATVAFEMWWLTDRKYFSSPCPSYNTPGWWNCGTALLSWDSTHNVFNGNPIYGTFLRAPQSPP